MLKALMILTLCVPGMIFGKRKVPIHEHGFWEGTEAVCHHAHDPRLAEALVEFFMEEEASSIVDFGCGPGRYVKTFVEHGLDCVGYDGNPNTFELTGGLCQVLDLAVPFDLERRFDWVLCLEVGEHLPKKFDKILLENLDRHNVQGIVLSWAVRGQGGYGHFNEKDNSEVKAIMEHYGYSNDVQAEKRLRQRSKLKWFKNTIMVFRKG